MEQTEATAARLQLLEFVRNEVSDHHLDDARLLLQAIEGNRGSNTPAHAFLSSLVDYFHREKLFTPNDVQRALMEFERDFEDIRINCEYAHRFYPAIAAKAVEDAKQPIR